jgi:hypothetical protein
MLGLVFGIAASIVVSLVRRIRREERDRLAREGKASLFSSPSPPA